MKHGMFNCRPGLEGLWRRLVLAALAPGLAALFCVAASPALVGATQPTERELHISRCTAALSVKADELTGQVKAGQAELRPALLATLEAGAAFIGDAYLHGARDEAQSQALLDAALQAQKTLPAADLAARQALCAQEAARLLSETNPFGRAIVSALAQRRLTRLLGE